MPPPIVEPEVPTPAPRDISPVGCSTTLISTILRFSLEPSFISVLTSLKILNPLLTNYVENNNINLVVEKKNILVGIKTLDITDNILSILNNKTKELKINEN